MKILLTGASGYIGRRLLPALLDQGHEVVALVRRLTEFDLSDDLQKRLIVVQGDLLKPESLKGIPNDIEIAYYLVHSMSDSVRNFSMLELESAINLTRALKERGVRQIIYLSGISKGDRLSPHLESRREVERIIQESTLPYTILRAGIVIGSGSASFEIIRDLTEKLPFMVAPRWIGNKTEPIAMVDLLFYLQVVIDKSSALNQLFELGSGDQLTYEEMLRGYAKLRGLHRSIVRVPLLTPRLSSYWLYFVTSTNFSLAYSLVQSLCSETVCTEFRIRTLFPHTCLTYEEAVARSLSKVEQNHRISSWRDAIAISRLNPDLREYIHVPSYGCFVEKEQRSIKRGEREAVIAKVWGIGGDRGWYYANWIWVVRGLIDKMCGGAGLNRGRTRPDELKMGDAVDFWRVLVADREHGRVLLYAEMRLPGEAWLEFKVSGEELEQTATFRPKGLLGRLYWYSLFPVHKLIFRGMSKAIIRQSSR